jgi:hypothetical protein
LEASVGLEAWEAVLEAWEEDLEAWEGDLEDVGSAQNLEVASVQVGQASVRVELLLFG